MLYDKNKTKDYFFENGSQTSRSPGIPQSIIFHFKLVWKMLLEQYHLCIGEMLLKEEKKINVHWMLQEIMRTEGFKTANIGQIHK